MSTDRKPTQAERILATLEQGSATSIDLNKICYRYSARLYDLRKQGYVIKDRRLKQGVWEYSLVKEPVQLSLVQ